MEFLRSNLWEIKKSSTVRIFGIVLSICHILTFAYWVLNDKLPLKLAEASSTMCWPVLESCQFVKAVPLSMLTFLFGIYVLLAIVSCIVLISSRLVGAGWFFVLLTTLVKAVLYFQDYRLSANIQYLHFLLLLIWLFLPSKTLSFKLLFSVYLFTSGINKLSPEWLTGQWFMEHLSIPVKLAEWLAALSAIIEFIAPAVLFFKDGRYFITAVLVLIAYFSGLIYINGFLAPAILLMTSSIFVLDLLEKRRVEREFIYQSFIRPEPSKVWTAFIVGLFAIGQLLPLFPSLPEPLKKTGTVLSLKQRSKINECRQMTYLIYKNKTVELAYNFDAKLADDTHCDPYLRFLEAKSFCDKQKTEKDFETVATFFSQRGLKDAQFQRIFVANDVCKKNSKFSNLEVNNDGV